MTRLISLFLVLLFSTHTFAQAQTLLVLGDSLSAGYNMDLEQSWPTLLPKSLEKHDHSVEVINGSISGDTTGNGLARLPQLLSEHSPNIVLIELGANDGLRGFPPKLIESNLQQIIHQVEQSGAKAVLMQIRIPPNYGKRYNQMFENVFPSIADQTSTPLIPFFLEQIILKDEWMMSDGLHPEPEAQPWIADFVAEKLYQYL